jgi:hypothetical protein
VGLRALPASERRPRLSLVRSPGPETGLSDSTYHALIAAVLAVGVMIRVMTVLASSFPVNDGGMFYAMARDIQASSYRLPAFTSYNSEHIPFFYPPLGFYMAAVCDDLTPFGLLDAFRVLPVTFAVLSLLAFALLARDVLRSRAAVIAAIFFFAVLPPAYTWMIMGGGLTRAPGFFFGLLTIRAVGRMYERPTARGATVAGALAAVTLLCHIEMAVFAGIASGVLFALHGRTRAGALASAAVVVLMLALSAPWWVIVVHQHGIAPLFAAVATTGSTVLGPLLILSEFTVPVQPLTDVLGALALFGVVACLRERRYLLPGWLLAVALFDQRAFFTSTTPAIAMLAGVGLTEVVLPFAAGALRRDGADPGGRPAGGPPRWLAGAVLTVVVGMCLIASIISTKDLLGLSTGEQAAMAWVRDNTPASSRFAVVSAQTWPVDRNSEWFPALTGRQSVATVQGSEWLTGGGFEAQRSRYLDLQQCTNSDGDCIARWAAADGVEFDYLYVLTAPPGITNGPIGIDTCCRDLVLALRKDARYQLVYDGAGAVIFKKVA